MLTLLATITASQGDYVGLDKGLIDGLRPGDQGRVFYTLKVDGAERTIEAGTLQLTEVDDFASQAVPLGSSRLKPGFTVSFPNVPERQTPAQLLRIASDRFQAGQLEVARRYLERLKALFPGDPLVLRRLAEIDRSRSEANQRIRDSRTIEYYLAAARSFLRDGDLEASLQYCDRVLQIEPSHEVALNLQRSLLPQIRRKEMLLVDSGPAEVGLAREEARFYNEQPRFSLEMKGFWIDQRPVAFEEYYSVMGQTPPTKLILTHPASDVTYREAIRYCSSVGKRLPTEFEWEIAAQSNAFSVGSVAEWTTSWYQPYPGNRQPEREYGTRYRVVRGYDSERNFDRYSRSFMSDPERAPEVGFRCAETDLP